MTRGLETTGEKERTRKRGGHVDRHQAGKFLGFRRGVGWAGRYRGVGPGKQFFRGTREEKGRKGRRGTFGAPRDYRIGGGEYSHRYKKFCLEKGGRSE